MKSRPLAGLLASLVLISSGLQAHCQSAEPAPKQTPDQLEQIKLKSAKWGEERQKATALETAKKYPEAEAIYKGIIAERQNLGLDLCSEYDALGLLYLKMGKKAEAEETFKAMIADRSKLNGDKDPQVVWPLNEYAACLDKLGKKDEAKKARAQAAAIEKESNTIPKFGKMPGASGSPERIAEATKMLELGEKCMKAELQTKALAYFDRALALNPNDTAALIARGDCLQWFNKWPKAQLDLNKAIKLKPDLEKAYVSRAFLHENLKQYPAAIADFKKAASLDPKDSEAIGSLAKLLDEQGKHKEAVEYYSKIITTSPALYWPYVQRAVAYTSMGQYKQAIADYSTLVERAPDDSDYYQYRGEVYFKAGDLQKALADYNRLIELNPKYSLGYHERARIYEKLDGKKTPRVVADYAKAKKLGY
ncbi:MAG: tetratricopeptide repeat protein [Cyanobacteria bacterium SZAS LIN-2]|nr:tetratricopeptide repeat protein [Cyanobacteria bacterium SZAS LIN-2]